MKAFNSILSISALFFICTTFYNCKKDDGPTAAETQTNKLIAKPWTLKSATVDGIDKTTVYIGFTLSFGKTTYSSSGSVVWPTKGTWKFLDNEATLILRDDNLEVTVVELTATKLRITFTWADNTLGGGRGSSVAGLHEFVME